MRASRCLAGVRADQGRGGVRSGPPGPPPLRTWNARCPDGRCAGHPTARSGAARCSRSPRSIAPRAVVGAEHRRGSVNSGSETHFLNLGSETHFLNLGSETHFASRPTSPQRSARRSCCGAPRAARLRRRASPFARAAGRSIRNRKAAPLHVPTPEVGSRWPAGGNIERRAPDAEPRGVGGAPQRGRRAGDSIPTISRKSVSDPHYSPENGSLTPLNEKKRL
jgi:hypothetical protein